MKIALDLDGVCYHGHSGVRRTPPYKGRPNGKPYCPTCVGLRNRKSAYIRKYGITEGEYDKMVLARGGLCDICKRPPTGNGKNGQRLHVDHDHETGEIRGLLCVPCNMGIGAFKENRELIAAAVAYLGGGLYADCPRS